VACVFVESHNPKENLTNVAQPKTKSSRPAEQTLEEIKYLKHLIDHKIPVCVKLSDDEEVRGVVEYYDQRFIRVTRTGAPNLFIFKHDIKYLYEVA
jgi:sRNA-binding regulator protein Hfq